MKAPHATALAAGLLGALALAGQPALANPAHHGAGDGGQLAQAQGQSPADEAPSTGGRSSMPGGQGGTMGGGMMGGGMMGGQDPGQSQGGMMMDPQMMQRMMQMRGMGMGGQGMGSQGMMGLGPCGMMMGGGDKDLSAEQVKDILEGHIAWMGNERLKVGTVEAKDEDTYLAEIVTVDDSLVHTVAVDRNTGAMRPAK